tara:strand:+ start:2282 stop:2491 length:210 start_codon:yes stop_codon:yes gene_type:complete
MKTIDFEFTIPFTMKYELNEDGEFRFKSIFIRCEDPDTSKINISYIIPPKVFGKIIRSVRKLINAPIPE